MSKAGSLRWNEDQLREYAAKRNRWGLVPTAKADEQALTESLKAALPTKYRNVREGRFASKKEAKRAAELELLQDAGAIRNLEH